MPRDYMDIGSAPADEPTAQVGSPNYAEEGRAECTRFLNLIRKTLGDEPPGARLAVKANPHDFGTYYSVVCHYDDEDEAAASYALRCESEAPKEWGADDQESPLTKERNRLGLERPTGGHLPQRVQIDINLVMAAVEADDGTGFCLACGDQASGVEPDARNYECQACGRNRVFGAEEILMMGGI